MVVFHKRFSSSILVTFLFLWTFATRTDGFHRGHITHSDIRSVESQDPNIFVDNLFEKYGNNGSMNLEQFRSLLTTLGVGNNGTKLRSEPKTAETNRDKALALDHNAGKCYSSQRLFDIFLVNSSGIDKGGFEKLCPAIVQQIDSKSCFVKGEEKLNNPVTKKRSTKKEAWGYGFLSVTIISMASLFGAFVVPFMNYRIYNYLLMLMVSLAVGVLGGSGLFHLIPHTFGFGIDGNHDYLWKCLTIVGGIYLFFVMEYLMKMYVRFKEKKRNPNSEGHNHTGHSHGGHSHSGHINNGHAHNGHTPNVPNSSLLENNKNSLPDNISNVAGVQLMMYKTENNFQNTHANSFCPSNELSEKPEVERCGISCANPRRGSGGSSNSSADVVITKSGKKGNLGDIAPVAWMIIFGDALHNFIDGLAIGASFTSTVFEGISTALAIFCEELPHELGDFAVLLNAGMTYKQAIAFNFFSACSCFAGLVVGLMLGYATSAVRWIYALAGGMFIYISLVDMMAEATEMSVKAGEGSVKQNLKTFALQNFGMIFGFAVMFILALYASNMSV